MALLTGFLQGLKMDSSVYLMERGELESGWWIGHSTNPMDYIFPLYSSIFLTAAVVFAVYVARNGRKSYMPMDVVMPGIVGGVLWGLGILFLFQADQELAQSISYPSYTTLMGIMSTGMGAYYGEFPTTRSRVLATAATLVRILAVSLIALSG